jgi:hypothetical protein
MKGVGLSHILVCSCRENYLPEACCNSPSECPSALGDTFASLARTIVIHGLVSDRLVYDALIQSIFRSPAICSQCLKSHASFWHVHALPWLLAERITNGAWRCSRSSWSALAFVVFGMRRPTSKGAGREEGQWSTRLW